MRNLKKVLSLALALVMLVGMMVVGAGAVTYGDSASVNKGEAVDVMSGIGVFTGNDAGNFNPNGYLNRQEAAKIIATVTLGPTVANNLSVANTGFSDVPAGSWASGYIAYCANENIIVGADGKFRPYDLLEATEFAKMLLVAAGKDPASYVGNGWNLNVQKDAYSAGLLTNVTMGAWFDPITRENAAQMALNAIQIIPDGSATTYVVKNVSGTVLYRGTDPATAALFKSMTASNTIDVVSTGSLADKVFGLKNTTGTDAFGRPTSKWTTNDGKTVVSEIASSSSAVARFTSNLNNVAGKQAVAAALKGYNLVVGGTAYPADVSTGANVTATGLIETSDKLTAKASSDLTANSAIPADVIAGLTGNGKVVEVYASGTTINKIVVIEKQVMTVGGNVDVRSVNGVEMVSIPGVTVGYVAATTLSGWQGLAKGDVLLVVKPGDVTYLEKAQTVSGVVTGVRNGAPRVNNVFYSVSSLNGAQLGWNGTDFTNTYTFYLDDGGFVVAGTTAAAVTAPTQYAVLLANAWVSGTGAIGESTYGQAQLLFTDGTTQIVTVGAVNGNPSVTQDSTSGKVTGLKDKENKLFTYTVDPNSGRYALTEVSSSDVVSKTAADANTKLDVTSGSAQMSGTGTAAATKYPVNNATIFLVRTAGAVPGTYNYTAYTGNTQVPSLTGAKAEILGSTSSIAKVVYIMDGTDASAQGSEIVYIPNSITYIGVPNANGVGIAYYEIPNAIVDGQVTTLRVAASSGDVVDSDDNGSADAALAANTLYTVATKNATTGAVTMFKSTSSTANVSLSGGTLLVGSTAYGTNASTVIYRIGTNGTVSPVADGFADATDTAYVAASNGVAKTVVIKEVNSNTATAEIWATIGDASEAKITTSGSNNTYTGSVTSGAAANAGKKVTFAVKNVAPGATYTISATEATILANGATETAPTITVTVTSEDGTVTATYTITVPKAAAT